MAEFHLSPLSNPNYTTSEIDGSHFLAEDFGDQIDDYTVYLHYLASRSDRFETYGYYDDVFGNVFGVFSPRGFTSPVQVTAGTAAEGFPVAELTAEELRERNLAICAVCTEEFVTSEKLSELPCGHYYHKECILPWLRTRNTCPLCRHEFPADVAEEGGGLS